MKKYFFDYKHVTRALPLLVSITNPNTLVSKNYRAIWDTGATMSVVTERVFDELQLPVVYKKEVVGVNSRSVVNVSWVDIALPKDITFMKCNVAVCKIASDIDVLLGMDIITKGSFLVDTKQTTVFTFAAN